MPPPTAHVQCVTESAQALMMMVQGGNLRKPNAVTQGINAIQDRTS